MHRPEMILFDYGNTLLYEPDLDFLSGERAVFQYVVKNPAGATPEQVNTFGAELFRRTDAFRKAGFEPHEIPLLRLKYEYFGIELSIGWDEAESVLWNGASAGGVMPFTAFLLEYLKDNHIRSGVISNIGWSGKALSERIGRLLPENEFEFILASSEYSVRKPDRLLFEVAMRKAALPPERIWFCGDSLECDAAGAHGVGIFPVLYKARMTEDALEEQAECPKADFDFLFIRDWREMVRILEDLK